MKRTLGDYAADAGCFIGFYLLWSMVTAILLSVVYFALIGLSLIQLGSDTLFLFCEALPFASLLAALLPAALIFYFANRNRPPLRKDIER